MLIVTTEEISGYDIIETIGLVRGNTVQSRNVISQAFAGLKTMIGGEIKGYTELLNRVRDQAVERMSEHAKELGADAVMMVRIEASDCLPGTVDFSVGVMVRSMLTIIVDSKSKRLIYARSTS